MDWMPLTSDKVTLIADAIGYTGQAEKASVLYENLTSVKYVLEDKVKFILSHWGWNGTVKEKAINLIAEINKMGFSVPSFAETVLKQLYGLRIPSKTQSPYDEFGETIVFELHDDFSHLLSTAELLSIKYNDDIVIPIGYMLNYCGSKNSLIDAWENPNNRPQGYYEEYGLFLGSSGKVYFDFVDGDLIGIRGDNFIEFLANSCGLIPYTHEEDDDELTSEDLELMEEIDDLQERGIYRQGQFKHTQR